MDVHKRSVLKKIQDYLQLDSHEVIKLLYSSMAFFFIIAAYSVLRSLKTSVFLGFVGREYEPISKFLSILVIIPAMVILAKITDRFKTHRVVYCFLGFYAVLATIFTFIFAHPTYGILNTQTSPWRLVGWAFEISMDLFQALVVGTFWSFLNSTSTPIFARKSYGFIVAGSRIGGITSCLVAWLILEKTSFPGHITIPFFTFGAALCIALAVLCIHMINTKVPSTHMHGYEAAYQTDLKREKQKQKTNVFEGLRLLLVEPYVLGILVLVFGYEIINIIFDYQMHVLMSIETHNQVAAMSAFMLLYTGTFQFMSFIFAIFGTSTILKHVGVKASLLIMPLVTLVLSIIPIFYPKLIIFFIIMVVLRALNYGFNHPLREILFIPTTKDIRFKSKAWIESFGRTLSKSTGSTFNYIMTFFASSYVCVIAASVISGIVTIIWAFTALLVGKKYTQTIADNVVIGTQNELDKQA